VASKDLEPTDLDNSVDAVKVVRIAGEKPVLKTVSDFAAFVRSEEAPFYRSSFLRKRERN
jgi:hypothetical protein